jgi:predicted Zn-dependent protease
VAAPPAIIALQSEAEASLESGDLDNAAAALERAIRIQPRNPELWHDLAEVRLKQEQPGLAEDLAKKSNLHAKGNVELIRANWAIIAEARRLKGDLEGAEDAEYKAGH